MADLSKVSVLGSTYNLKDAKGREDLAALIASLGTAAYEDVLSNIEAGEGKIVDAATIKAYVDAQVGAIHKFDVVVADELPDASAETMYKLYLIPKAGSEQKNVKEEWITIRLGTEGAYTYQWEKIGDTAIDLSGYVQKTQTIAGIDLQDNITVAELQGALELGALAYLDEGSVTISTADSFTMNSYTPSGDVTLNAFTQTPTAASITAKSDFTPAGTITGDAIKDGSISVSVKDADTASEASLTYSAYTPAGSVTLAKANDGSFQVSGTINKPAVNVDDSAKAEVVTSLKAGSVDAASFTEGEFTPASISEGFFSAGSQASYEHTGFDGGSFSKGTAVQAAIEGVVASVGTGSDAETLILSAAQKDNVMDFDASFTAATYGTDTFVANTLPSIDVSKFDGGSKDADTFSANKLPVVDGTANAVTAVSAELAAAPEFTGDKFAPAFSGTEVAEMKVTKATYLKQEIDEATFTGTAATLGFSGTKVEELIPSTIQYDKATANGASFSGDAEVLTGTLNKTDKTVEVDFE